MSPKPKLLCKNGHLKTGENAVQTYSKGNKDGVKCRKCAKDGLRKRKLFNSYGLTLEKYNTLFESQNLRCAICKSDNSGTEREWHIDHDHVSGKTRSILCHHCNLALGHAKDNPKLLRKMADYIESYNEAGLGI